MRKITMSKFQDEFQLPMELPDDEIQEFDEDHPSQQEIHAPGWDWGDDEDDEDEEGAEITRVFIPFSR
jgi:hypothetical protein